MKLILFLFVASLAGAGYWFLYATLPDPVGVELEGP